MDGGPRPDPELIGTPFLVPVVDIGPYVEGGPAAERAAVAAAFDAACRTVGFVQVTGHGVPAVLAADLAAAVDAFFALAPAEKVAYRQPPGVNRGYTPPRAERLASSLGVEQAQRMNDFFEAFNVGTSVDDHPGLDLPADVYPRNVWPEVEGFTAAVSAWFAAARRVAHTLLDVAADALGLPAGWFGPKTDHAIEVLRLNNYALPAGQRVELSGDLVGMGEHTDYGLVTVLWADDAPGLQVLGPDSAWHPVSPGPGALLVNLGDLTARLTNERWLSTLHRVMPPVVDGAIRSRRSAAFFLDGNVDAVIAPLPDDRPPLYPPVTVGEHLAAKLAGSRGLVSNTAGTEREAARVTGSR